MHDEGLVASAARLGRDVPGPGLCALAEQHRSVVRCGGIGALWRLELVRDRETREPLVPYAATGRSFAPMAALSAACLDRGLITFVFGNRISVAPPPNLSDAEAADGLAILDEVLSVADDQARLRVSRRPFPNSGSE
jgi:taurine---2-oxoglutarate transaminase